MPEATTIMWMRCDSNSFKIFSIFYRSAGQNIAWGQFGGDLKDWVRTFKLFRFIYSKACLLKICQTLGISGISKEKMLLT